MAKKEIALDANGKRKFGMRDSLAYAAGNKHIVGDCFYFVVIFVYDFAVAVVPFLAYVAAEAYGYSAVVAGDEPVLVIGQPDIGKL